MSLKIIDFGTNRKPICDFLLVISTNFHHISHRFEVIADCWSNMRFLRGVPLFSTLVLCEPLYRVVQNAFRYLELFVGMDNKCDGRTDRQDAFSNSVL